MKKMEMFILACLGFLTSHVSVALSQSEVLWVTIKEDRKLATEIAMPLSLVQTILEASEDTAKVSIADTELSVQTLKKALQQTEGELLTVFDHKTNAETQLWIREFEPVPTIVKGSTLVVEVYESGKKSTTVRMPNIVLKGLALLFGRANIAGRDMGMGLIDALTESGGFVYIKDYQANSETWIYEQ